jgi:hypothetical protein
LRRALGVAAGNEQDNGEKDERGAGDHVAASGKRDEGVRRDRN